MRRRMWMKSFLVFCFVLFGAAACSDTADDSQDNRSDAISDEVQDTNSDKQDTETEFDCATFRADNPGGGSCSAGSDCSPVACPCADGSTISTTSCFNGVCDGESVCEEICGSAGYLCEQPPANNNNNNDNNSNKEPDVTSDPDTTTPTKSCVAQTTCSNYVEADRCSDNGCTVETMRCAHLCDKYPLNPATCLGTTAGQQPCPNLGAESESACTESSSCAWLATCENPVDCSDLDSESACSNESTCAWE